MTGKGAGVPMVDTVLLRRLLSDAALVLGVAVAAAAASLEAWRGALLFNAALIDAGEWWRVLSANFAHLSARHLALNLVAWLLIFLIGRAWMRVGAWIFYLAAGCLSVSACLYWFAPGDAFFGGLSGALHGLFAVIALRQLGAGERLGFALLALLAAKLVYEGYYKSSVGTAAFIGVPVAAETHLYGTLGAVAFFLLARLSGLAGLAGKERKRPFGRRNRGRVT